MFFPSNLGMSPKSKGTIGSFNGSFTKETAQIALERARQATFIKKPLATLWLSSQNNRN
jgi:hypothetical protein